MQGIFILYVNDMHFFFEASLVLMTFIVPHYSHVDPTLVGSDAIRNYPKSVEGTGLPRFIAVKFDLPRDHHIRGYMHHHAVNNLHHRYNISN